MEQGYTSPYWTGKLQCLQLNYQIKKGKARRWKYLHTVYIVRPACVSGSEWLPLNKSYLRRSLSQTSPAEHRGGESSLSHPSRPQCGCRCAASWSAVRARPEPGTWGWESGGCRRWSCPQCPPPRVSLQCRVINMHNLKCSMQEKRKKEKESK